MAQLFGEFFGFNPEASPKQQTEIPGESLVGSAAVLAAETEWPYSLVEGSLIETFKRGNPRSPGIVPQIASQAERFFKENQ